jgi:hypothetical protein
LPEHVALFSTAALLAGVAGALFSLAGAGRVGHLEALVVLALVSSVASPMLDGLTLSASRLVQRLCPVERSVARAIARVECHGTVVADLFLALALVRTPPDALSLEGISEATLRERGRGGLRSGALDRRVVVRVLNLCWLASEHPEQALALADHLVGCMPQWGLPGATRCVRSLGLSSLPVSELTDSSDGLRFVQDLLDMSYGYGRGLVFEEAGRLARSALTLDPAWRGPLLTMFGRQVRLPHMAAAVRAEELIALLGALPQGQAEVVRALHDRWDGDVAGLVAAARAV